MQKFCTICKASITAEDEKRIQHYYCKKCSSEYNKKYYIKNKEKEIARSKNRYIEQSGFFIYEITCVSTGLAYIGQTKQSIKRRFNKHFADAKANGYGKLNTVIRECNFNRNNFLINVLQICNSQKELDEAEEQWINEKRTLFPNGYNTLSYKNKKPIEKNTSEIIWEAKNRSGFVNVEGFNGYEINKNGTIYSKERILEITRENKKYKKKVKSKKMKIYCDKSGYPRICLMVNSKKFTRKIHILVARTFLGLPSKNKPLINHKDLNKSNYNLDNLEYVSNSENAFHYNELR